MVAGHSLEILCIGGKRCFIFEDLKLVSKLWQCKSLRNKTFDYGSCFRITDNIVEEVCASIDGIVVAANYNCPGQLVISGE
jgi:[acyl-carrier-protein] S-malonyltransferase